MKYAVAEKGNGQKPLWASVSPAPDHPRYVYEARFVTEVANVCSIL
jgi:hypothetical protein